MSNREICFEKSCEENIFKLPIVSCRFLDCQYNRPVWIPKLSFCHIRISLIHRLYKVEDNVPKLVKYMLRLSCS